MSLVVLEGLDGSGKGTQTKLLAQALAERGTPLRQVTFPDYESPSSALVRMYLNGEFGSDPESVNAYAASAFYAVDRYASFQRDWKAGYLRGDLILCDRYATSNMVYQMGKVPREEWNQYLAWVEDFEYERLGIPRPDLVLYLDMPIEVSQRLLLTRYQGDSGKKGEAAAAVSPSVVWKNFNSTCGRWPLRSPGRRDSRRWSSGAAGWPRQTGGRP